MKIVQNFSTLCRTVMRKVILALTAITMVTPAMAQGIPVTGTVTSQEGEPLAGVTVMVDGSKTGTSTDIDGKYTINTGGG